jgi:hypothetical protein
MAWPQAASDAAPSEFIKLLSDMHDPKDKKLAPIAGMHDLCRILERSASGLPHGARNNVKYPGVEV